MTEAKTVHWEGSHTIQSFWLFSAQSPSVVEKIPDDMLCVAPDNFRRKNNGGKNAD